MSVHPESDELAGIAAGGIVPPPHIGECEPCAAELRQFLGLTSRLRSVGNPPSALRAAADAYFERRRALDGLVAEMAVDPEFRSRVARDPAGVLREAGLDSSPELVQALRDVGRDESGAAPRLAAHLWI